jgi:hypothetical protein
MEAYRSYLGCSGLDNARNRGIETIKVNMRTWRVETFTAHVAASPSVFHPTSSKLRAQFGDIDSRLNG